jgi:hypothetical protein
LDFPPGPLGHPPGNLSHVPPPSDPLHLQCIPVPSDSAVPDDVVAWRYVADLCVPFYWKLDFF